MLKKKCLLVIIAAILMVVISGCASGKNGEQLDSSAEDIAALYNKENETVEKNFVEIGGYVFIFSFFKCVIRCYF